MRILMTGNMGYVGPQVVSHLRATYPAAELVGIDMGYFAHCLTGAPELPEHRMNTQHFADVRHVDSSFLEGFEALVMLAAVSNDPMGNAYESVTAQVNCESCVRLARLAKRVGVGHVVFASSCSVYGFAEGGARSEDAQLNPLTAYAHSKINAENALRDLADESMVVTCLRFPTACGMSSRLRLDLVSNDFVASAMATGNIEILSDGTPWRPIIDTQDMALAIEWAIDRKAENGGSFLAVNAGCNEANFQVGELAETVRKVLPEVTVSINPDAPPDKRSYRVDFSKYQVLAPNHQPGVPLKQSVEELVQGLAAMNFSDSKFRESQFIRLRVLNNLLQLGRLDNNLEWLK
jgi:nucleoside-diphosphate-sugar epimerase